MITLRRALVALPAAAAVAVLAVPTAFADTTPVSSLDFTGGPDTFPVRTSGHWAEPDQEVLITNHQGLKISAGAGMDYMGVQLSGPNAGPLQAGTYRNLGDPRAHPGLPSVLVIYDGLGCYAEEGDITVDRIETDSATGLLTAFDGSFDQRCHGSTGTFHGEIHYQR